MHKERREDALTRAQGRITLTVGLATTLVIGAAAPAAGQTRPPVDPATPCCSIVSINGAAATATAKNAANRRVADVRRD